MEMERGVVGDLCLVPGLEDAVRESGIVDRCRALFAAARTAGIRVVHCTAAFRPDRVGSYRNMLMTVDDPAGILPRVLAAAEKAGVTVTDLSIEETTLETVFINLTGKDLRE